MAPPLTLMVPSIYSLMEPFILSMILALLSGTLAPPARVFPLLPWKTLGNSSYYAMIMMEWERLEGACLDCGYHVGFDCIRRQFKEKLGARGFGAVYKGVLSSRAVVAVKQLEGIEQGEKQFRMEVATISSTHHLNLVRLIGFCAEGHHRLLVYEFMKNGSLDNFLFTTEEHSGKMLSWEYRHNVALGTTGGIMYLHEECRDCIIHCDIKPENTLLDEIFNAKMSDFGLAKVINAKDNRYRILTSVREARSYLRAQIGKSFIWAHEEFEKGNIEGIVDKKLVNQDVDMEQITRAIQPSQRSMMGKVIQMLKGITNIKRPPVLEAAIEGSISKASINGYLITCRKPLLCIWKQDIRYSPNNNYDQPTFGPLYEPFELSAEMRHISNIRTPQ
ncbi:hypothetical protein GOBAR_DD29906 [Gossypium barbadense]|nr:hypothetical protein GOBAR_DD29906 [Gossypium barbadense]